MGYHRLIVPIPLLTGKFRPSLGMPCGHSQSNGFGPSTDLMFLTMPILKGYLVCMGRNHIIKQPLVCNCSIYSSHYAAQAKTYRRYFPSSNQSFHFAPLPAFNGRLVLCHTVDMIATKDSNAHQHHNIQYKIDYEKHNFRSGWFRVELYNRC